jgi:magnesium transporter
MVTSVPVFPAATPAGQVRQMLKKQAFSAVDAIYVSKSGRLVGEFAVAKLFAATDAEPIEGLAEPSPISVHPQTDQELVAAAAHRSRSGAVPVVDENGSLLGVVPAMAIIQVMQHEHSEDLHRLAGIRYSSRRAQSALTDSPWTRVAHRVPWLMIGLAGAMLTALAMAAFEPVLQAHIAIAFFVPAIVYLADAIGTQTEAVVVRGLSHGHLPLAKILLGELATGAIIGALLGLVSFPLTYWWFASAPISLAVSLAIALASAVAASVGLMLPWMLSSRNFDPAFGSGPLATIIQDILSILIYLGVVTLLV